MVVHYIFCGSCNYARKLSWKSKSVNGNINLVVASPSRWHPLNLKDFYSFIKSYTFSARLMIKGLTDMNCGKKGGGRIESLMPEYVKANEKMRSLVLKRTQGPRTNIFFLDANRAYHESVNASRVFVANNVNTASGKGLYCDIHLGCTYGEEMLGKKVKRKGMTSISYVKYAVLAEGATSKPYFEDFGNLYFTMAAINPSCGSRSFLNNSNLMNKTL